MKTSWWPRACVVVWMVGALATGQAFGAEPQKAGKAAAAKSAPIGLQVPFEGVFTPEMLKSGGHDLVELAKAAQKLPKKSDFETDEMYEARLQPLLDKPQYGRVALSSRLLFRVFPSKFNDNQAGVSGLGWLYDPDTEQVSFKLSTSSLQPPEHEQRGVEFTHLFDVRVTGTYTGTNSFGKSVKVTQKNVIDVMVVATYPGLDILSDMESPKVPLARTEAEKALASPRAFLIGRLAKPYRHDSLDVSKPTITSPTETTRYEQRIFLELEEVVLFSSGAKPVELVRHAFGGYAPEATR